MPPQLTPEEQVYAIVSDLAYAAHKDNGVDGQYSVNRIRTKLNEHIEQARARGCTRLANDLNNLIIVEEHCNQNTVTVINEQTRDVIVGFRGTNPISSWNGFFYDFLANDIAIGLSSFGLRRPLTALEHTRAVMNGLGPGYQYTVTGHSLGGSTAEFVSWCCGIRGVGFNGGSGLYNVFHDPDARIEGYNYENRYVNHRINWDPLSALHAGITRVHEPTPGINRHSLSNFLQYGRDNQNNHTGCPLGGVDFSGARVRAWPNHSIKIGSISGAVFSGSTATLLAERHSDSSSTITTQDLAVALVLAHFGRDPAFSLDPWEPTKPDGPWLRCVYYPEHKDNNQNNLAGNDLPFSLAQTGYGRTLFEADWLLKQLSFGVNLDQYTATGPFPSPLPVRKFSPTLVNLGLRDRFELESSHTSSSDADKNPRYTRFWITVDREETLEGLVPPDEACLVSLVSCSEQIDFGSSIALRFSDVKLGVQVMRMARDTTGQLEDVLDPRASDPTSSDVIFARLMTNYYDDVARHYLPLQRLRELAKLQAVAKWMMENDVDVDISAALKYIQESTSAAIEKVPALERKSSNLRLFGGVNLSVRQKHHDRAPEYSTLDKRVQTELKDMIRQSISTTNSIEDTSTVIPLPFIKKKHCSVCDRPLDFASLFRPSISSGDVAYCNEHHPDACYQCMLPLYFDPVSRTSFSDSSYKFISIPNSIGHDNNSYRYHPTCFLCAVCDAPIVDEPFKADPDVLHVYYHLHCYSPIISNTQRNTGRRREIIDHSLSISSDEQVQLEMVLLQSREEYESQQRAGRSTDCLVPHQDSHSFPQRQPRNTLEAHDYYENQMAVSLSSEDEDSQLVKALQLSMQDRFSCPFCANKFGMLAELEEHVQLHLDN